MYVKGIRELRSHIYAGNYSAETAAIQAPQIMYMAACLLTGTKYVKVEDFREYMNERIENPCFLELKYLKKAEPLAYAYLAKTDKILTKSSIIV